MKPDRLILILTGCIFFVHLTLPYYLWTNGPKAKILRQQYIYRTEILELFYEGKFWQIIQECNNILQEYPDGLYFINYLGQSEYYLGYIDDANFSFNQLLKLAQKQKDNLNVGIAYHNLGKIANKKKNYNLANSYYQKAIQMNTAEKNRQGEALNYQHMAINDMQQDHTDKAIQHIKDSIQIQNEINDLQGLGNSYHILARIQHYAKDKHQTVISSYRKSLHFLKKTSFHYLLYSVYNNLGYFQFHRKNHTEALESFSQALLYAKKTKHILWIQKQELNLAILFIRLSNNKQARSHLNNIITLKKTAVRTNPLSPRDQEQQSRIEETTTILINQLEKEIKAL